MAVRYIRSRTTTTEPRDDHRDHWDEEVMQALVTAGALVALSDGRVEAVERDELVNFVDQQGFVPTISRLEIAEAFGNRVPQLDSASVRQPSPAGWPIIGVRRGSNCGAGRCRRPENSPWGVACHPADTIGHDDLAGQPIAIK